MSANTLRKLGLCEDHFSAASFANPAKTRLRRDAIPNAYEKVGSVMNEENVEVEPKEQNAVPVSINYENIILQKPVLSKECPVRTYKTGILNFEMSAEEEDIMEWVNLEVPTHENVNPNDNNIEKENNKEKSKNKIIKKLRSENINLRKKMKRLNYQLQRMTQAYKDLKDNKQKKEIPNKVQEKRKEKMLINLINEKKLHPVAKTMIHLQLHTPRTRYTEEEKILSKQLYYYSASAFCRLKKTGCNFPGQRTVRRWVEEYDVRPGFCDFIFEKLKEKIAQIPEEERICALKWDEMSIKSYEEYSSKLDEIEGLVDLGPLGRRTERSKCVFVFCLDSLNARHPWRQPLAYFLPGKCIKSHEIVSLLKLCLDKLYETGANVKLVTCDQGTNNQAAFTTMGVNVQKPYFLYNNRIYYASYDFPHLVKRLASFLRTHDKIFCKGEIIASYSDFVKTWSIDNAAKGGSNLLSHITQAHIRPNCFEAMNVKRAFQLFSHRFAAAIKLAGEEKELQSDTWKATADFAEYMNSIIDACNSYSLNITFGGKRPLSKKNSDIEILLSNFMQWCMEWSKCPNKINQVPCFKGFAITIQAILVLYNEVVSKNERFELATGLCNQDSVEQLFSKLRQRGGFNPNPTARMVRLSIRHILSTGYIQTSDKGNVQCRESEALINKPNQLVKTFENYITENNLSTADEEDIDDVEVVTELLNKHADIFEAWDEMDKNEVNILSNYDDNAITYFAGYIARRCVERSDCQNCREIMLKTPMEDVTSSEKYIEYREYPNIDEDAPTVTKLIRPTSNFTDIIKTQLMSFNHTWQRHWASTQVLEKIVNEGMYVTNNMHAGWFDAKEKCYNHRIQALKLLMTVKIYSRTRYNNRDSKAISAFNRKVKNVSNK